MSACVPMATIASPLSIAARPMLRSRCFRLCAQSIGCIFVVIHGLGFPGCLCCLWHVDKNFRKVNLESVSTRGLELPPRAPFLHAELDQEKFVEPQAPAGGCQGRFIFRVVYV